MSTRQLITSGTPWEEIIGYSRAVRVGSLVFVSGTTASDETGKVYGIGDPYEQTVYIIRKIERALAQADASLADVVRVRMFVTDIARWEDFARGFSEFFKAVRPVSTMVEVQKLIDPEHLIEIEVDAVIGESA